MLNVADSLMSLESAMALMYFTLNDDSATVNVINSNSILALGSLRVEFHTYTYRCTRTARAYIHCLWQVRIN